MTALALAALLLSAPLETPVTMDGGLAPLHGTLLRPDGPTTAAALIIPGSGPTDRDGNSPYGVINGALKQLAEGLAEQGIASVRIDKRGVAASRPAGPDEATLTLDGYAADARAWADVAARETGRPCVWLVGHSEGALVAQLAAEAPQPTICGLVLISAAGRSAGILMREQMANQIPPEGMAMVEAILVEFEAGRTIEDPPAQLAPLARKSVQPYMISWLSRDPAPLAARYNGPIFIGQGTTDLQTKVVDAEALAAAQPNAKLVIWDEVNHVLVQVSNDLADNTATYFNAQARIDPRVIQDVADFIKANTP